MRCAQQPVPIDLESVADFIVYENGHVWCEETKYGFERIWRDKLKAGIVAGLRQVRADAWARAVRTAIATETLPGNNCPSNDEFRGATVQARHIIDALSRAALSPSSES
jgi:hypothetical protein